MKSQLKDYNIDLFDDNSTIYISTDQELDLSVLQDLTRRQRSTNPGPNAHVLSLHQKTPQADGWEVENVFLSNGNHKINLIYCLRNSALEREEYRKCII